MTYLYEGTVAKAYFDLEGFKQLKIDYTEKMAWSEFTSFKNLIEIIEIKNEKKLNLNDNSLSVSWFNKKENASKIDALKSIMVNFFKNKVKTISKERLWTTFVDFKEILKGEGYSKKENFLPFNKRATNEYRHANTLAFTVNVNLNPIIYNFFIEKGVKINKDLYSTGELIQWIFRSSIRDGKPIKIFIPSPRMKRLLKDWIEMTEKFYEFNKQIKKNRETYEEYYSTSNILNFDDLKIK